MSQNKELTNVKLRIKALSEKTVSNGCSEAEAQSAMEKVGQLLEQYNLTMEEIDIREEPCVTITIKTKSPKAGPENYFVVRLAEFADCKVWRSKLENEGVIAYYFFGLESDTQMVQYLYNTIVSALTSETRKYKDSIKHVDFVRGQKKVASCTFQRSFANRIAYRLLHMKTQMNADLEAKRETGTALVLIKNQIVEQAFQEQNVRLRKRYTTYRPQYDGNAAAAAYNAANNVNLSRPVGSETGRNKLIA